MPIVTPWNTAFNNTPANTDQVSEGNERIQDVKLTVRDEFKVEHDVGDASWAGYTDSGRHIQGSARTFFVDVAPTTLEEPDETAGTDRAAVPSNLLDNGRLWVDWGDCQPFVREQTQRAGPAWTDLTTNEGHNASCWVSLWPRQWTEGPIDADVVSEQNVAGPNVWEPVTSAAGIGGTDLGVQVDCPNDGRSYEIVVMAHCSYYISNNGAMGFRLTENIAGGGPLPVDTRLVHNAGAAALAGEVTLMYLQPAPTAGSDHVYIVEFIASHTDANKVVNPDSVKLGVAGWAVNSWTRISATCRPRYLVGAGTYTQV